MALRELLSARGLEKSFSGIKVLKGVDLSVGEGEFVTILGPSGCGKTTTLRILSGLTEPDRGEVWLGGEDITGLPPEKRSVNTVFQSYALFPHMNVEKNIAYGLKIRGVKNSECAERVREMLRLVRLEGYEKRMPDELSGGQRQRIAIARSAVLRPRVLLLDEPLGALDLKLRRQMQFELKRLQQTLGIAFVYITHDQEEALNMSDRIAVMHAGRIDRIGTPAEVYDRPLTRFSASFIGQSTLIDADVAQKDGTGLILAYAGVRFPAQTPQCELKNGRAGLCLRCERVRVVRDAAGPCALPGKLLSNQITGSTVRREVLLTGGDTVRSIYPFDGNDDGLRAGDDVYIVWDPERAAVVPAAEADDEE